ncbi:MAG TPA: (Fe-S)-binding protein [Nitrospirota bacterium]|nr:(Fe-S)-binding protein [Nitrospirota bacterium]
MTKLVSLAVWQATAEALSCGRTVEEQVETVRKFGNQGTPQVLRARLLSGLGIPKPKAQADTCVFFGCYRLFTDPFLVRDYLRVLDRLQVDWTYLDQEYCCGAPFAMLKASAQRDEALKAAVEFNQQNDVLAREKGARRLAYCCMGCAHAVRSVFHEAHESHLYMPDLIFDELGRRKLVSKPLSIGYFEGCHTFVKSAYSGGSVDWSRYRKRLDEIEGLHITDLAKNQCCKTSAGEVVDQAVNLKVDAVLCSCNWCSSSLGAAGQGRLKMISLPELLLGML